MALRAAVLLILVTRCATTGKLLSEEDPEPPLEAPAERVPRITTESLSAAIDAALAETGASITDREIDCSEYPCMFLAHCSHCNEVRDALLATPAMQGFMKTARVLAITHVKRSDGTNSIGIQVVDSADMRTRKDRLARRLVYRIEKFAFRAP